MELATVGAAAIVLAAGASTRMGRPKALIQWRGRPFVSHCVATARAGGCARVWVIEGAVALPDQAIQPAHRLSNPDWSKGQLSSLQVGLRVAVAHCCEPVVVLTVDRPHILSDTVATLIQSFRGDNRGLWQPTFGGRRGHPIAYPSDLAKRLLELEPTDSPRSVVRAADVVARRRFVEVNDPAVGDNIDTPLDLARLRGAFP